MSDTKPFVKMPVAEDLWRVAAERDDRYDGFFVFAVRTTGVYCRPFCPARRPKRENAVFFDRPEAAKGAGFRPCKRCRPQDPTAPNPWWSWRGGLVI